MDDQASKIVSVLFVSLMLGSQTYAKDDEPAVNLLQHRRSIHKSANIDGSSVLECDIVYPSNPHSEHILTWKKGGKEVPIFIQFNEYPPHIAEGYQGRIRMLDRSSMELSDIRTQDEGLYRCSVTFLDGSEEGRANGTWNYLTVNLSGDESGIHCLIRDERTTATFACPCTTGVGSFSKSDEKGTIWSNGIVAKDKRDRFFFENNSVIIRDLIPSDEGEFVWVCDETYWEKSVCLTVEEREQAEMEEISTGNGTSQQTISTVVTASLLIIASAAVTACLIRELLRKKGGGRYVKFLETNNILTTADPKQENTDGAKQPVQIKPFHTVVGQDLESCRRELEVQLIATLCHNDTQARPVMTANHMPIVRYKEETSDAQPRNEDVCSVPCMQDGVN